MQTASFRFEIRETKSTSYNINYLSISTFHVVTEVQI